MTRSLEFGDVLLSADPGFASGQDLPDGVLQVRMNNVRSDGSLDWEKLRRVPLEDTNRERYLLQPEDILFNSTNSPQLVGKSALFTGRHEPVVYSNHFLRLRVDTDIANTQFIAWWLNSLWVRRKFENLATRWVNQAAVRKEDLLELTLSLPDVPIQERIVATLDAGDRLRRASRFALELTDSVLEPAFIEWFQGNEGSVDLKSVEDLSAPGKGKIRTGPFGSQLLHSEFVSAGISVLGIDNVVNNRFEWAKRRFITPTKYKQLERYTVHPEDVLITIMATCGRCAVVPEGIGTVINTKHLCCITLDQRRCLPIYLQGAFLYHPFVRRQLEIATNGAIMDGLNMDIIKDLDIPLPPIPEQQRYTALALQCDQLWRRHNEESRQAENLFHSLLRDTFQDELNLSAA